MSEDAKTIIRVDGAENPATNRSSDSLYKKVNIFLYSSMVGWKCRRIVSADSPTTNKFPSHLIN